MFTTKNMYLQHFGNLRKTQLIANEQNVCNISPMISQHNLYNFVTFLIIYTTSRNQGKRNL
jgi:hypothetical protein